MEQLLPAVLVARASDVVFEGQRNLTTYWAARENFTNGVGEFQCHRHSVRESAAVVIELGESQHIVENDLDVVLTAANIHNDWFRDLLASGKGLEAWHKAFGPKKSRVAINDVGETPQNRHVTSLPIKAEIIRLNNPHTDNFGCLGRAFVKAGPLLVIESGAPVDE
jgi:hypothetical protein